MPRIGLVLSLCLALGACTAEPEADVTDRTPSRVPARGTPAVPAPQAAGAAERPPEAAAQAGVARPASPAEGLRVGEPIRHGNLAVYPIYGREKAARPEAPRPADAITLDEALARKLATVREVESGGEVNRLTMDNASDRPILIVGGEIVCGGKQDRVIAQDLIVPPGARGFALDVFCVEHGRWTVRPGAAGGALFVASAATIAGPEVRKMASIEGAQAKVWAEVAATQAALERHNGSLPNQTGSYAILAANDGVEDGAGGYVAAVESGLDRAGEAPVGFVAAIDGKLVLADVFGSQAIAAKLRAKMLRSYAMGALASEGGRAEAAPAPPKEEALKFVVEGLKTPAAAAAEDAGHARRFRLEDARFAGQTTVAEDELIHATLYAK